MTTVSLQGLTKTNFSRKGFQSFLSNFKNIKTYEDFGDEEYIIYTSENITIGAFDINTKEVWIKLN